MEGTRLGPYQLLAELGTGGMGKVYRAEVAGAVHGLEPGCAVALKVIHAHLLETPGFFKRFLREADLGRTIEHENVVRTFDCDALLHDGAQQNFLVMEYVEGQTLRDLLQELDRLPEELCRHIGREVAKGLAAIHEAGVVHRDLKPENVLITPDHVVKIMDLGVARLQAEAIRLSQTGAFIGSLEYAAPEQFRSSDGEPDGRADLHALGVLLYELATGQHPYRDEDVSKVLRNILEVAPRKAGEVNPQLSPFFEEVVHTLLAKDREERFAAASGLASVLEEGEQSEWWRARAQALRVETKRPLRRIRIPRETALYGRDDDLAWMHRAYDEAKAGDGQVLLIGGEAGIGKTRLVDEFVGRLRDEGEDVNFLFASYPPGGAATAAGAFSMAFREQFGSEGLERTLETYLAPTPILIPAFAALLRGETTPGGAEPLTRESVQTVFVHATRGLAAERTTIVLIDDLHFAPEDGRALFASLAIAVPSHRILLLGTMRPGVSETWIANVERLDQAEQRDLQRLGPKDLGRLLIDAFRSERLAAELGLKIATKSDGNPFFAFEIIRGLREGQFIAQQPDGTWITTKLIEEVKVPSSVLDLVNARVAELSEQERDVLDVASCCGFEFDPLVLAEVVGLPRIALLKALGQTERRHRLVRASGRRFAFDHHQVQEALYGSLSDLLREEYHTAIADSLEAQLEVATREAKDLDGAFCVDLCHHLLKGGQGARALRYLEPALDHLQSVNLMGQAVDLADRVLGIPGLLDGEARVAALTQQSYRQEVLGLRQAQEDALAEASALVDEETPPHVRLRLARALGAFRLRTGDLEGARTHLIRTLDVALALGDLKEEAHVRGPLGIAYRNLGRYEEARVQLERQLAIGRELGDVEVEGLATVNLGIVLLSLGQAEAADDSLRRGRVLLRESGDRRGEADATAALGGSAMTCGRYEEAEALITQSLGVYESIGVRRGEAQASGNLGILYLALGRYDDAVRCTRRALAITRETGSRMSEANALVNLGPMWLALGDPERARRALEASLAISREIGTRSEAAYALEGLAYVASEMGDGVRAEELADEALALRRAIGSEGGIMKSLVQVGRLRHQTGDTAAAREAIEEAMGLLRDVQAKEEQAIALSLLACLPGGDARAAESALAEAGNAADRPDARYHLWKATGSRDHLIAAKRGLDHLVEHAPEEYRESMLENVRLHREIMEAWAEHGESAEMEAEE